MQASLCEVQYKDDKACDGTTENVSVNIAESKDDVPKLILTVTSDSITPEYVQVVYDMWRRKEVVLDAGAETGLVMKHSDL